MTGTETIQLRGPMGFVFALVLLGVTGFINWLYFDMLIAHHAMRSWQEVPAKILQVNFHQHSHANSNSTSQTTAEFAYDVGGTEYKSTSVTWLNGSDSMGSFQSRVYDELNQHKRSGRPFRCFVNPSDPAQAILYRDLRPENLVLFTAMEMMLGMPLVLIMLKQAVDLTDRWWNWPSWPGQSTTDSTEPLRVGAGQSGWEAIGKKRVTNWAILFALGWNGAAIPLYVLLPMAPTGTFWPRVIGMGLIGIGWLIIWQVVVAWRAPKPKLGLGILPE